MNKILLPAAAFSGLLLTSFSAFATRLQVPAQYATVQAAINAATDADTILVAPGRYFENINFKGKNIVLASHFLTTGNRNFIRTTILDGSQPAHADTASVVRMVNGEDSTTVLAGFTITGGKGTRWPDAHGTPVRYYREGGGVLMEGSSAIIRDNFIYQNEALLMTAVSSAGGGAIRADGGNPQILNNVIMKNQGRYGAGIVLNFSGGIISNNIIAQNTGGDHFGGSGIWVLEGFSYPKIITNNTIISNTSGLEGGGVLVWNTSAELHNNIVWGNAALGNLQVAIRESGTINATYNNIQGGYAGTGNISQYPSFSDTSCYLLPGSASIDAGDPAALFNDPADPASPANALAPAMGTLRNDMGAYGGPRSQQFVGIWESALSFPGNVLVLTGAQSNTNMTLRLPATNRGTKSMTIDSITVRVNPDKLTLLNTFPMPLQAAETDTIRIAFNTPNAGVFRDTIYIYHNDPNVANPRKYRILGNVVAAIGEEDQQLKPLLQACAPSPSSDFTTIRYQLPAGAQVRLKLYDALGREAATLLNQHQPLGEHEVRLNTAFLAPGIYYVSLETDSSGLPCARQKLMVVR